MFSSNCFSSYCGQAIGFALRFFLQDRLMKCKLKNVIKISCTYDTVPSSPFCLGITLLMNINTCRPVHLCIPFNNGVANAGKLLMQLRCRHVRSTMIMRMNATHAWQSTGSFNGGAFNRFRYSTLLQLVASLAFTLHSSHISGNALNNSLATVILNSAFGWPVLLFFTSSFHCSSMTSTTNHLWKGSIIHSWYAW